MLESPLLLPPLLLAVLLVVSGAAKLLGPDLVALKGGATGFWVETTGAVGDIEVRVTTQRLGEKRLKLRAK